jgi:hypothetical protein
VSNACQTHGRRPASSEPDDASTAPALGRTFGICQHRRGHGHRPHNPKVGGSNPPPATRSFDVSRPIPKMSWRLARFQRTPTELSTSISGQFLGGLSKLRYVLLRRGGAPPTPRHAAAFGDSCKLSFRCPVLPYRSPTEAPTQTTCALGLLPRAPLSRRSTRAAHPGQWTRPEVACERRTCLAPHLRLKV